jgi:class 3 adenylate cyclase
VATVSASTTRYARCDELNIAYQVVGDGDLDLVWVPNWLSNVDMWRDEPSSARFFDRLASFSRLIIFDRRGSGVSDPVVGAPTLEERMDDIRIVMDEVGSERAALFGFSEGAPMASLFAASHPERVSALVLYGAYARSLATPDYPWAPAALRPGGEAGRWDTAIRSWGTGENLRIFAPSMADDARFRRWWGRFERAAASPASAVEILRLNREIDVREILPAIGVPTLVLHREGDRTVAVENARFLAREIPGARLVEQPGDDHVPMVGDQDALLGEVEEFLTGVRQEREPDRVLATVLFTDIVGSTERAGELGDRAWRDLLASHDALVRQELERHRGREIKTVGDGFLATFDGPARAIRCAVAATRAVSQIGVQMRAGLHTGEVEVIGDDVGGMAVHIGARVGASASPGEVLVSGTVRDLVVGSGIGFHDRGAHTLRGVPGEWRLFAVG